MKKYTNFLFIIYFISLFYISFSPVSVEKDFLSYNILLFNTILDYFSTSRNLDIILKNLLWNIILFILFSLFLWFYKISNKKILTFWLLLSILIEILQFLLSYFIRPNFRVADIDDIILNFLWVLIWLFLAKFLLKK